MKIIPRHLIRVLIMALSVLAVAGSDGQEQDKVLGPQYENLVEQLRDPSSTIRGRAIFKLSQLDLSARLEVTAALFGCDSQERDKPLNPKYEKVVQQLGDPSYTVRQQAYAKLLDVGLSAQAEVTAALDSPDAEVRYKARQFIESFIPFRLEEYLLQNPGEITLLNPRQIPELLDKSPKDGSLFLQRLESIDKDVARELAKFKGKRLGLNGLQFIDKDTAAELAKFEGEILYLQGLNSIDKEVAQGLASFKGDSWDKLSKDGWLRLEGLVALDKDVARELAKFEGHYLALNGLKFIDKIVASELVSFQGHVDLQGLKSIDKDIAQELAKFEGKLLDLDGLESIDKDVARELASLKGRLGLGGLKSIDREVAKELARRGGEMGFGYSLKSINKEVARELAKWKGKYLNLQGLESIDKETAQELVKFESHCMYLTGLISIDKDILDILQSNPAIKLPKKITR